MNRSAQLIRWPLRVPRPTAQKAAAIVGTASLALLAAACGASPSSTRSVGSPSAGASPDSHALAFARCVRSHGVPNWPDPESTGTFDKTKLTPQQLGASSSQIRSAGDACQRLLPNTHESSQAGDQQTMSALVKFARCVRSHGVSNWPDPLSESDPGEPDTPGFPRDMQGVSQSAPQVKTATDTCQHFLAVIGYGSGGYP
jgi:hypothetical protein